MDTASQVKASLEFEEMLHQQKLLDEYQRLGSPYPQVSDLVPFVLVVLALLLCHQFALVDAQTLLIVQWASSAYFCHVRYCHGGAKKNQPSDGLAVADHAASAGSQTAKWR